MVNGLHLYSTFIQSAVQFMPLIHPFTHTFIYRRRLAAMIELATLPLPDDHIAPQSNIVILSIY